MSRSSPVRGTRRAFPRSSDAVAGYRTALGGKRLRIAYPLPAPSVAALLVSTSADRSESEVQEALDQEALDQEADDQEALDQEADDQEALDQEALDQEADDHEALAAAALDQLAASKL